MLPVLWAGKARTGGTRNLTCLLAVLFTPVLCSAVCCAVQCNAVHISSTAAVDLKYNGCGVLRLKVDGK